MAPLVSNASSLSGPLIRALGLTALVAALAMISSGCGGEQKISSIEPIPPRQASNPELGPPEVRPITYGPGDKDSPSWSPTGERIAFLIDGYIASKPLTAESYQRRTTRDLQAVKVTWPASGEELAILGAPRPSELAEGPEKDVHPLYATRSEEGDLKIERLAEGVLAISSSSGDGPLLAALESGAYESRISLVSLENGPEVFGESIPGRISDLSVSPDGRRALAAALVPSAEGERYEIYAFDLTSGEAERLARLPEGMEILGAPQQTSNGVYYVAGEASGEQTDNGDRYSLYRLPEGPGAPQQATGVGRDFITSSIKVSPDGSRLALLGRRDSASATNLYILDLADGSLDSATVNENMEIKTGADSMDWSNDGDSVAIVARNDLDGTVVYEGAAETLLANFYNIYEVPVDDLEEAEN